MPSKSHHYGHVGRQSRPDFLRRLDALSSHPEQMADEATEQGDFAKATELLVSALADRDVTDFNDGQDVNRIKMKLLTIDMAELSWYARRSLVPADGLVERCGDVHGLLGALLEEMQEELRHPASSGHQRRILRGDMAEATVLLLAARDFNNTGRFIMTPSPRERNHAGTGHQNKSFADDITTTFLNRSSRRPITGSVQVKTRKDARDPLYSGAITTVYLSELEGESPGTRVDFLSNTSLVAMVLRELRGKASDIDEARLDRAGDNLYRLVNTAGLVRPSGSAG